MYRLVNIQTEDFDLNAHYTALRDMLGPSVGAIAAFVGLVRDRNPRAGDGSAVATLRLEHYPGMTETSIDAILDQAQARWPLLGAIVIHRVGDLCPEDQIVMVLIASGHRDAAFAGAEFVMDYLKTEAVLWKKEVSSEGEQWLQSTADDASRRAAWQADQAP